MNSFPAPKDFDPETDIPNLSGKVILVTGGNSGLGASTVRYLAAAQPSALYIAARTQSTATALVTSIHATHPNTNLHILPLDLSSLSSVKTCAAQFLEREQRLDVLMLNGGIFGTAPAVTEDGHERHFGTNYLGHALLTQLLLPTLLTTARSGRDVRIVHVSSKGAHHFAPKGGILFDKLKSDMASYSGFTLYGQSKLAQVLMAHKMTAMYPEVLSVSVHPGTVETPITRGVAEGHPWVGKAMDWLFKGVGVSSEVGCRGQVWCAVAPSAEKRVGVGKGEEGGDGQEGVREGVGVANGAYYEPVGVLGQESVDARSEELKEKLWEWTERELAEKGGPGWVDGQEVSIGNSERSCES